MITIKGKYNTAIIYADTIEENAAEQIELLCNQAFVKGSRMRIMPDVHAGAGCVIGFTADLGEMVIPNIVGVDIGCGMLTVALGRVEIDFAKLDEIVRAHIPCGTHVRDSRAIKFPALQELHCYRSLKNTRRIERSIGTLGGGNHFIEVGRDGEDHSYLVVHTGSRNLGKQVAEFYQHMAYDLLCGKDRLFEQQKELIAAYKAAGKRDALQAAVRALHAGFKAEATAVPKELCYLTGEYRGMYLHDMKICQAFAACNRAAIADAILQNYFGKPLCAYPWFETVHNYIDLEKNLVRKGAVSARIGEKLLIPINMRDGSLLCIGKGNEEWNCSAPHGAGRLYSRTNAKERFTVDEFQKSMEGIFSTSIGEATLDESPMAYKSMEDIVNNIAPTAEIVARITPLYNFKACE